MTDCREYRVRIREFEGINVGHLLGDALELVDKKGNVLLLTQNVSVQTLVELVAKDKEKR